MQLYKSFLSLLLILIFSHPLGMSALITAENSATENSLTNSFSVPKPVIQHTQARLQSSLNRYRFNGTALIAIRGKIIFEEAKGKANFSTRVPLKLESSFQLASASKPFTALSIMILKERGKLNYDDKVSQYIPEFPYPKISIRNLLNHTSGLQNYMYLIDHYWINDSSMSNQKMLDLFVAHHLPLNNIPGRRFEYSNTGYAMLALLVEKITHKPFADFLKSEIFDKLGMTHTFVYKRKLIEENPDHVIGYNYSGRRRHQFYHDANNDILGDKSIYSSVGDIYKFTQALNNYELVEKSTLEEAYSKAILHNKRSINYGFGWRIKDDGEHHYIFHNGAWHGFTSTITREPKENITIILLNNTNAHIGTIKRDLLSIVHAELDYYLKPNSTLSKP